MKQYTVAYRMYKHEIERTIIVKARNKQEAYRIAAYKDIPNKEGCQAYSVWVYGVTYNNGNYKSFNTIEGMSY